MTAPPSPPARPDVHPGTDAEPSLVEPFLLHLLRQPRVDRELERVPGELDERLGRLLEQAGRERPGLLGAAVDPAGYLAHVAQRLPEIDSLADLQAALDALHAGDLLLAFACAEGQAGAVGLFDREILGNLRRPAAGMSEQSLDELRQLVRERLLLGEPGRPPRIASYLGMGPLGGWVRVTATRVWLNERAREAADPAQRGSSDAEAQALVRADDDVELDYLQARYREDFKRAVETAVEGLDARDRMLLKLHVLDGLSIDRLGAMYRVHRATAARWIGRARQTLVAEVRRELGRRLGAPTEELESLIRAVKDNLEISLHRLLAPSTPP